ncbi:MAG TPA: hypothetical protein VIJ43_05315 [Burkholderiales bacterium]
MAFITMSIRERAFLWFFVGFFVFETLLSGILVYGLDYDFYLHGARVPKHMSFGVGSQIAFGGAAVSAVGNSVGTWCFHAACSGKQSVLTGALYCAAIFCTMAAIFALDFDGFAGSQTGGLFLLLVICLDGLAMVPLSKRTLEKKASDVKRG